jgi:hypothetical protein
MSLGQLAGPTAFYDKTYASGAALHDPPGRYIYTAGLVFSNDVDCRPARL